MPGTRSPLVNVVSDEFVDAWARSGLSITQLSERAQIPKSTAWWVIDYARGTTSNPKNRGQIGIDKATRLADALGMPVGRLFYAPNPILMRS